MRRLLGACGAAVLVAAAWACGESGEPEPSAPEEGTPAVTTDEEEGPAVPEVSLAPEEEAPVSAPSAEAPATESAAGPVTPALRGPDPWPKEAVVNYTQRFGVGRPRGVAVDDAFNIWLLDGNRIGVLRPGTTTPLWASNIGQAGRGFASTVICGGSAGRAYVGYHARELDAPKRQTYHDPVFTEGDMDVVRLTPQGIQLEEHLYRSFRRNKDPQSDSFSWVPPVNIGIHNSNNWQYDEDRAVLSCVKVMRGRDQGDVYIGTNHGVTRIKGLYYNSHRHPVWRDARGGQHIGYTYAVGIAQDGDVLIGNDWTFGIVTPNADLGVWDWMSPKSLNPMKVESSYLPELNSLAEFDYWRGFQQTKDGRYYLASRNHGLWEMTILSRGNRAQRGTRIHGLPTQQLTGLAATDDSSLFIVTGSAGLWRMDASKGLARVTSVPGNQVRQLVYDPTASPAMLYVLTDAGLTVLRGH